MWQLLVTLSVDGFKLIKSEKHRKTPYTIHSRSQWPRGLRRRSAAVRLLRLWVRIPPGAWRSACCECCVLSGRGLGVGPITRPEVFFWLWCVVVCDLETSWMRRPCPTRDIAPKTNTLHINTLESFYEPFTWYNLARQMLVH